MSPMGRRQRHRGVSELHNVLSRFVRRPSWISYDADRKKAKTRPDLIAPQAGLIREIATVAPSLSLVQTEVETALLSIWEDKKDEAGWARLPPEQSGQWAKISARRLRTLLRHVSQARTKKCGAAWLQALALPPAPTMSNEVAASDDEEEDYSSSGEDASAPAAAAPKVPSVFEVARSGKKKVCAAEACRTNMVRYTLLPLM